MCVLHINYHGCWWSNDLGSQRFNIHDIDTVHYCDVIIGAMASQIASLTIVHSTVYSGVYQRKHQSSASLAFVWGIHRWPVNSPHKWLVTWKMFPFDEVSRKRSVSVPLVINAITLTRRCCVTEVVNNMAHELSRGINILETHTHCRVDIKRLAIQT